MSEERESSVRVVSLEGEYDISRKREVTELFDSIHGGGPLVIDMAKVSYLDSTILAALASLRIRLKEQPITLAGANSYVRRLFNIVSFDKLFEITE